MVDKLFVPYTVRQEPNLLSGQTVKMSRLSAGILKFVGHGERIF
jgi:hypothetical protein